MHALRTALRTLTAPGGWTSLLLRMSPIGVVTNPNSGKNRRNPGRRGELERALGRFGVVRQTHDIAELERALAEFLDLGTDVWVCDGGDGTLHWMLTIGDRLARERGRSLPRIVPANGGSIDFVAHRAGIRGEARSVVQALIEAQRRADKPDAIVLDTFRMRGRGKDGSGFDHLGFASAIGGIAQRFFGKLYEKKPVDGWSIWRVISKSVSGVVAGRAPRPLQQLLPDGLADYADEVFAPTMANVDVDGKRLAFDSFASLQIGSIDINLGGVVRTFRHAHAPGVLHAQAISSTPLGVVANLPNIVLGTPIWGSKVYDGPATRMRVTATGDESLDPVIDGEMFHGLAELEVSRGPQRAVPRVCS
jgi:hypothetical protein